MHPIENHIEQMFSDLPETAEIKRLKDELYVNMLDRYNELLAEGKTENEALGTVIIETGDRDDWLETAGYNLENDLEQFSVHTLGEAQAYLSETNQNAQRLSLGIFIILFGVGVIASVESFRFTNEIVSELAIVLFLVILALGIGVIILTGMKISETEGDHRLDDFLYYLPQEEKNVIASDFSRFKQKQRYRIPLGVILCILSPVPILIFEIIGGDILVTRYGVMLLLIMIGLGVYQFISYGMNYDAYQQVLNLGEYSRKNRRMRQRTEPISGIYWSLVTAIYLAWSFITFQWHITWIVWPIAGVVWGFIAQLLSYRDDEKY